MSQRIPATPNGSGGWSLSSPINATFDAYGENAGVNQYTEDPFDYNARWGYYHDSSGFYYYQNRYYDPGNARWLTRDPIGFAGGMNLYGYCGAGPVGRIDTTGERSLGWSISYGIARALSNAPPWLQRLVYGSVTGAATRLQRLREEAALLEPGAESAEIALSERCKQAIDFLKAADEKYPKLAEIWQNHHVKPKYAGGAQDGPTVRLPASVHQLITNAFRKELPFGKGPFEQGEVEDAMRKVYERFPIPGIGLPEDYWKWLRPMN